MVVVAVGGLATGLKASYTESKSADNFLYQSFSTGEYISAKLDLSVPIPLKFFLEKDSRLDSSRIIEMIFLIVDCIRTSQIKEEHADEKQKVPCWPIKWPRINLSCYAT